MNNINDNKMDKLKAVLVFKYCYKVDTSLRVSSYDSITFNLANQKKSRYFRVVVFLYAPKKK